MSEQMKEQVLEWHKQGMSTGEIALALGWERTSASRKKIRAMLEGREIPNRPKRKRKNKGWTGIRFHSGVSSQLASAERVQRSTGHWKYPTREKEAEWILDRFEEADCKFKGKTAEFLNELDLDNVTPDDLFYLRDVMSRKRNIMDAS
jgi:hypothetical protein